MKFRYIECLNFNAIIQNFYELQVVKEDLPLTSSVVPTAQCHIVNINSNGTVEITFKKEVFNNRGTLVLGQSYNAYKLKANVPYYNFGINLHPTALYKLTGRNISEFTDKHLQLSQVDNGLHKILSPLFEAKHEANKLAKLIEKKILEIPLTIDKNTRIIDEAIHFIYQKQGIVSVDEVLNFLPISQKHLETQFKKIVGLTPLKFIKMYKFLSMMKVYEKDGLSVSNLIDKFNYYDLSHFTKDFKLFMNQKPSDYFKTDHEFLNNYLKS